MAALSRIDEGGRAILFAHVFVINKQADFLEFEILKADAESMETFVGVKQLLACDGETFWGELVSLETCTSTALSLSQLRHKPTLRGRIQVFTGEPTRKQ